jgi:hypothetical protein
MWHEILCAWYVSNQLQCVMKCAFFKQNIFQLVIGCSGKSAQRYNLTDEEKFPPPWVASCIYYSHLRPLNG